MTAKVQNLYILRRDNSGQDVDDSVSLSRVLELLAGPALACASPSLSLHVPAALAYIIEVCWHFGLLGPLRNNPLELCCAGEAGTPVTLIFRRYTHVGGGSTHIARVVVSVCLDFVCLHVFRCGASVFPSLLPAPHPEIFYFMLRLDCDPAFLASSHSHPRFSECAHRVSGGNHSESESRFANASLRT